MVLLTRARIRAFSLMAILGVPVLAQTASAQSAGDLGPPSPIPDSARQAEPALPNDGGRDPVGGSTPSGSPAPPVEQLVERALTRAPSIQARQARMAAAVAAAKAADALPEPMLEVEYRAGQFPLYTIGLDPGSMLGATYTQNLLSKGRRRARREAAEAETGLRGAELSRWATDLTAAVKLRYAELYALDRERETMMAAAELLRMLEATVSARYAAGESDQASVLRVQLERSRLGERLADLENDRVAAQTALNRLLDDPPDSPIGPVQELPSAMQHAGAHGLPASAPATSASPDLTLRRADIVAASREVASARAELRPAWSVGGGLFWQGGWSRMAVFNVGVELPIWKNRKQAPLIEAAESALREATLQYQDAAAEIEAEAARLASEWRTADAQIERYRGAILPQSSAALDATRTSYLVGRADFVAVLEQFENWIEVRVGLAKREADRFAARVRLDALLVPAALPVAAVPGGTGPSSVALDNR